MMQKITEIKEKLNGQRMVFECAVLELAGDEAVVLFRSDEAYHVEDVIVPSGSLSVGYFWTQRFYNIYHWVSVEGETLALYINISDRTRITPQQLSWRDLIIDVLITPDGRCRILDEHELPPDLDSSLSNVINTTRDELVSQQRTLLAEMHERSVGLLRKAGMI